MTTKQPSLRLRREAAYYGSLLACNDGNVEDNAVRHDAYTLFWTTLTELTRRARLLGRTYLGGDYSRNAFAEYWAETESVLRNGD